MQDGEGKREVREDSLSSPNVSQAIRPYAERAKTLVNSAGNNSDCLLERPDGLDSVWPFSYPFLSTTDQQLINNWRSTSEHRKKVVAARSDCRSHFSVGEKAKGFDAG